ncbi:hypothetical protein LCGC14_0686030 [marine sediment metagenome]|uniref:Uncharacterized protein n=1 Tax=marine sediment metagenome TaxID=412755 RepID=A0A0F9QLW2_9ZZZZ
MDVIQNLVDEAFREVVRRATVEAISQKVGSAVKTDIKSAISDYALDILKTDPELQQIIKDRLYHWIKKQ